MVNQIVLYFVVLSVVLGSVVSFVRNIAKFNRNEKLVYLYLIASFGLWVIFNAIADIVKVYSIADFAARISLFFSVHVSTASYLLASIFPQQLDRGKSIRNWEKFFIVLAVLFSVIIIVTLYTPLNVVSFAIKFDAPSSFVPGILYTVMFAFSLLIYSLVFVRWFTQFYKYTNLQREQIKLLGATLFLTVLGVVVGFVILPTVNPELSPYSILAHLLVALFLYQLQVNILSKETIINFSLVIKQAVISTVTIIVLYSIHIGLSELSQSGANEFAVLLTFPLLILLIGRLYYLVLDRWTRIPAKVYSTEFNKRNARVYKTKEVIEMLNLTLKKILPHSIPEVRLAKKSTATRKLIREYADIISNKTHVLSQESLISDLVKSTQVSRHSASSVKVKELLELFSRERISYLMPLIFRGKVFGIVTIRGGIVADSFIFNELNILIQNAAIALSRAELYQEVEDFAKSLSRKVKEKTTELAESRGLVEKQNDQLSKALAELKSVDKSKSDFISMASHQLRTPISIARGYISMLTEGDFGRVPEKQLHVLEKVHQGMKQLNNIVEDILNTSRIEQGRLTINREMSDITGMVRDTVVELETKAKNKGLSLINLVPANMSLFANIDKNKVYEVVVNIIDNSIAYTLRGTIAVSIENKRSSFIIKVKDTGIGIPNKQKKLLFQRFSRLDNAKKIRPDGSGIGLFTAKTIVDMHGGKIWFTSRINKGTTFYVELPKDSKNAEKV